MPEEEKIFNVVAKLLSEHMGVKQESITMETSLLQDCGMAGDDADEFFELLDETYQIDWDGIDLGPMFGSEGMSIRFPWNIHTDREIIYKTQPCLVSDIVGALAKGMWIPKKLEKKSMFRIGISYFISFAFYGFLTLIIVALALDEIIVN